MKVDVITTHQEKVYSIQADKRLCDASMLMNEKHIGALMVLNEDQNIVGIVTERDVLNRCACGTGVLDTPIEDIMTPKDKLIFSQNDSDLLDLMGLMTRNSIRHIPILDQEKLVGIVSIRDVVKVVLEMKILRQM